MDVALYSWLTVYFCAVWSAMICGCDDFVFDCVTEIVVAFCVHGNVCTLHSVMIALQFVIAIAMVDFG